MKYSKMSAGELCDLVSKVYLDRVELFDALMEVFWVMRWNKERTVLAAALSVKEVNIMCLELLDELDEAGFEIVRK